MYCSAVAVSAFFSAFLIANVAAVAQARGEAISFRQQIAPVLAEKCLGCHNASKQKGGFQLHTFAALKTPGTSRVSAVVPYRPGESRIYQVLISLDPEERMPNKEDPLPSTQIELIRRWIQEGAHYDGPDASGPLTAGSAPPVYPPAPAVYPESNPVRTLAFSPDGASLAVGGYHEILLYDPETGALQRRLGNVNQQTYALAFNAAGDLLAAASGAPGKSGEYKLFRPHTGESWRSLAALSDVALAINFNSDGSRIAAGGADNTVRVFESETGRPVLAVEAHTDWLLDVVFTPDSTKLICASRDKTVRVIDSRSGELLMSYLEHENPVYTVVIAADGKHVFSADAGGQLHVWELEGGKKRSEIKAVAGAIYRMQRHREKLFLAGADQTVREYRDQEKPELVHTYQGSPDHVFALALFPKRNWVAGAGYDGTIRIWLEEQAKPEKAFSGSPGR